MKLPPLADGALRGFRRTWPHLLVTDLIARGVALAVITPLVGGLLKLFLLATETGVLTDEDIALFLLHPIGIAGLLIIGGIALAILFAEQGVLMVIGFGATEDRRLTYLDAAGCVLRASGRLLELGGHLLARVLLISLPFLAGLGLVYRLLLAEYDINFYLSNRPPEFRTALILAGTILFALAAVLLQRATCWSLALAMVLFEGRGGRSALAESSRATAGHRIRIAARLAAWALAYGLLSALVAWVAGAAGDALIPDNLDSIVHLALALGAVLCVAGLGALLVAILSTALFPLFLVQLFLSLAGPGSLGSSAPEPGTLRGRPTLHIPGKAALSAAVVLLLLGLGGAYLALRGMSVEDDAQIIAHRGASGSAPENTMAAFQRAITDGADWIELDVQEDAEGTVIVQHDSDFMKVAGVPLKAWNATQGELAIIDVGSYFGPEFREERVPTLKQVLELARGELGVFIELKYYGHDRNLEARVAEIVEETGMQDSSVVMSLRYAGVRKLAALRPDWTYGLLTTVNLGDLTRLDLDFVAVNAARASYSFIRHAHRRGMKVYAWTVNDPVQMSVMMSRGIDGIITDEPALAGQVQELRDDLSPVGRLVVWIAAETGLLRGLEEVSTEEDA